VRQRRVTRGEFDRLCGRDVRRTRMIDADESIPLFEIPEPRSGDHDRDRTTSVDQ
jgi:hypothetical protein